MGGALDFTSDAPPSGSDYVTTLFRDATSSHLLETLVSRAPDAAFEVLWSLYFVGNVSRLAAHPVANFVLAKAVGRCEPAQLAAVCAEVQGVAAKTVSK
jgi:nucleolar protein 9